MFSRILTRELLVDALRKAVEEQDPDSKRDFSIPDQVKWEIVEDDGEPESLSDSDALWVTGSRTLLMNGEPQVSWTRCSRGCYGEPGRQELAATWCVEEDTNGGDTLPESVAALLELIGPEDRIPDVPEPPSAEETYDKDFTGCYAAYWSTVLDDSRVVARYATREAAEAVVAEYNRRLFANHPGTNLACSYTVAELCDGKWLEVREDDD